MASQTPFGEMNLSIIGLGTQYPAHEIKHSALRILSEKFYPESESYVTLRLLPWHPWY